MTHPLVSILMPAYNAEKYIGYAIESILLQTFNDFELVIVNDGSTDKTEQIVLSFKDPRIRYFAKENEGVARTLNYGLERCRGKYIRRHDADDLSTTDSLEKQIQFILAHPDVGLVSSRQVYMTENGKIAWRYGHPHDKFFNGKPFRYLTLDDFTVERSSPVVHGTALFERELVLKLGGYRPEFRVGEDNDLWTRIMEHRKAVVLNHKSYFQRLHSGSATARYKDIIVFYRKMVIDFALERQEKGSDPLMRGEPIPQPSQKSETKLPKPNGKIHRSDLLDFQYKIYVNARDWKLIFKTISEALRYGWKLKQTWKAILFPLLGEKIVKFGVKVKSLFKRQPNTNSV